MAHERHERVVIRQRRCKKPRGVVEECLAGLRVLALCDVDAGTDVPGEFACGLKPWNALLDEPAILAIRTPEPKLRCELAPRVRRRAENSASKLEVVWMNVRRPTLPAFHLHGAARELEPRSVDPVVASLFVRRPD